MTNKEFVQRITDVATKYKTLYVLGGIGSPLTAANKTRYINSYSYNKDRLQMIQSASSDTFAFDCVCLIKSILWGWNGNKSQVYGGAKYASNGVPDIGADEMITRCKNVSTNFNALTIGEIVWIKGHVGVYIGNGLVVECTPAWKNGVQITSCNCTISGYKRRNWTKHGKLPYITYNLESAEDIINELVHGKHKVKINEVTRAVKALDKVKNHPDLYSLYWILYKLVNGND